MSLPFTIVGNLTADPEMRFIPSGAAVASFTIAHTERVKDGDDWKDGDSTFIRCTVWRQQAENVAESLAKGMRVIATGRLKQRSYETNEGEKRTVVELDVDDVGPALKNATAKVNKVSRENKPFDRSGTSLPDDPWAGPVTGGTEAPF